jgi:hypothetical protein
MYPSINVSKPMGKKSPLQTTKLRDETPSDCQRNVEYRLVDTPNVEKMAIT